MHCEICVGQERAKASANAGGSPNLRYQVGSWKQRVGVRPDMRTGDLPVSSMILIGLEKWGAVAPKVELVHA